MGAAAAFSTPEGPFQQSFQPPRMTLEKRLKTIKLGEMGNLLSEVNSSGKSATIS